MIPSLYERNQQATVYAGNLDQKVNQNILWELFIQCGPVVNVHIPRDKITNQHQGYGFVQFKNQQDADYSIKIMHMIKLFGKPVKVNKASQDKRAQDVGANIFVGNLDPQVDERQLYETFNNFGTIVSTKIARDPADGSSKGHGFVSFDNFQASDLAIAQMNGQYFSGRQIRVDYAIKKDTKGQRHGSYAERLLAENRPAIATKTPNQANPNQTEPPKVQKTLNVKPGDANLAKGSITANLMLPPKPMTRGKLLPNIKLPPVPLPPTSIAGSNQAIPPAPLLAFSSSPIPPPLLSVLTPPIPPPLSSVPTPPPLSSVPTPLPLSSVPTPPSFPK